TLCEMGMRIAETMIELFGELPENHPFFEQLTFMTAEELPDYRAMMARVAGQPLVAAAAEDRQRLLRLPLHYVEVRHRLGLVDEALEARIVKARQMLHETMPSEQKGLVDFYRADQINAASSLQDNILFGRVAFGIADGPERVRRLIQEVLEELKLEDVVYAGGLSSLAGSGGKRLTHAQRQKIALGRAILKRPDLIIINRGLAALDGKSQAQILASLIGAKERGDAGDAPEAGDASPGVRTREGGPIGLFCVVPSARLALAFDRVLAFENGELVEDGRPEDLKTKGGAFARLLA
ncbi:MAG: ABC transporter ATP-binding protein, partial [Hyphomicrobiaceae bacterium]